MQVIFRRSFAKDLKKIRRKALRKEVQAVIEQIEQSTTLYDLPNVKHLTSEGPYYRIRIGDYRLGLLVEDDTATASLIIQIQSLQQQADAGTAAAIQRLLDDGVTTEEDLLALLLAGDLERAFTACWLLGQLGHTRTALRLMTVLRGQHPQIWRAVAVALSQLSSRRTIPSLIQIMTTSNDPGQREAAAYALAFLRPLRKEEQQLTDAFLAVLINPAEDPAVRAQAAEGLANRHELGDHRRRSYKRAVAALTQTLEDTAPEVRFWSAFALGKLRAKIALPALTRLATTDRTVVAGWWRVGEEASDAITLIQGSIPPERTRIDV